MKQLIRRLTAAMLCAALCLASPFASAQDVAGIQALGFDYASLWASLTVTMPDGSQQDIPVSTVTTTLGDVVYWVDQSVLTPEQIAALATGQFTLINQADGAVVAQFTLEGSGAGSVYDQPVQLVSPTDANLSITLLFSSGVNPLPSTPEEADAILAPFGYATPEPSVTEPEEQPVTEPEQPVTEPEQPVTEPEQPL